METKSADDEQDEFGRTRQEREMAGAPWDCSRCGEDRANLFLIGIGPGRWRCPRCGSEST